MALLQRPLRQLVSTSSLLSLARIAGAMAGFANQILLARTLQAPALGLFYSVTSLAAVMGVVAALGYPEIVSRFVSRYREKGPDWLLAAFLAHVRAVVMVGASVVMAGILVCAVFWPGLGSDVRFATGALRWRSPQSPLLS